MPTIQLKLTDQQFNDLLKLTGEATGIKAVKSIIQHHEFLVAENELKTGELDAMTFQFNQVNNTLNQVRSSLDFLRNI